MMFFRDAPKNWFTRLHDVLLVPLGSQGVLRQEDVEIRFPLQFFLGLLSEKLKHGAIHKEEPTMAVFEENDVRNVFEESIQKLFRVGQFFCGVLGIAHS